MVNDYHFLAVFQVPEYYLVKEYNGSEGVSVGAAIGTVDKIYPPQTRFALAGLTWETVEVNAKAKVIFVKRVPGVSTVDWNVDFDGELHTVLVQAMRRVLSGGGGVPVFERLLPGTAGGYTEGGPKLRSPHADGYTAVGE